MGRGGEGEDGGMGKRISYKSSLLCTKLMVTY